MGLNRDQIIAYGKKYWNRICDDGKIGLPNELKDFSQKRQSLIAAASATKAGDWDIFFVPSGDGEDAVFARMEGVSLVDQDAKPVLTDKADHLNDCTHYVSKCLVAGGVSVKVTPRPQELITELMANRANHVYAEKTSQENGQKIIDAGLMKPGDVIGYCEKSNGNYHHSAVYTGDENSVSVGITGGMTCHSNCRFGGVTKKINPAAKGDDAWFIHDGMGTYTLIHFTSDDKPVSTGPLQGWWEREDGTYTYIDAKGAAHSTWTEPGKQSDRPMPNATKAKSYPSDRGIAFVWTMPNHDIDVEIWRPGMYDSATAVVWRDEVPEMATRMFQ